MNSKTYPYSYKKGKKGKKLSHKKKDNRAKLEPESFSPTKECCYKKKIIVQKLNKGPSAPSAGKKKEKETSGVEPGTLSFRSNVYKQTNKHCLFLHSNRLTSTIQKSIGR